MGNDHCFHTFEKANATEPEIIRGGLEGLKHKGRQKSLGEMSFTVLLCVTMPTIHFSVEWDTCFIANGEAIGRPVLSVQAGCLFLPRRTTVEKSMMAKGSN